MKIGSWRIELTMALCTRLPLCKGWNPFLTMATNVMYNQLRLCLHWLTFAGRTVKGDSYVGIDDPFGMRSVWMVMRQMFEPLGSLDKSSGTRFTVERFHVFVFSHMIKHRILLFAYIVRAMGAYKLAGRILRIFGR
jgi:hypothetical protein